MQRELDGDGVGFNVQVGESIRSLKRYGGKYEDVERGIKGSTKRNKERHKGKYKEE